MPYNCSRRSGFTENKKKQVFGTENKQTNDKATLCRGNGVAFTKISIYSSFMNTFTTRLSFRPLVLVRPFSASIAPSVGWHWIKQRRTARWILKWLDSILILSLRSHSASLHIQFIATSFQWMDNIHLFKSWMDSLLLFFFLHSSVLWIWSFIVCAYNLIIILSNIFKDIVRYLP